MPGDHDLTGISCIARGADSVFAQAALTAGGRLEMVLPSRNYRQAKVQPDHAAQFDELIAQASNIQVMDFDDAGRETYPSTWCGRRALRADKPIVSDLGVILRSWGTRRCGGMLEADVHPADVMSVRMGVSPTVQHRAEGAIGRPTIPATAVPRSCRPSGHSERC